MMKNKGIQDILECTHTATLQCRGTVIMETVNLNVVVLLKSTFTDPRERTNL